MPDTAADIKKTYDASLRRIQEVLFSQAATAAEKRVARQSLTDLTMAMLLHNLASIEGRLALLSSLIVELREVTDAIKTDGPAAEVAKPLTDLLTKAHKLFKAEKKVAV